MAMSLVRLDLRQYLNQPRDLRNNMKKQQSVKTGDHSPFAPRPVPRPAPQPKPNLKRC